MVFEITTASVFTQYFSFSEALEKSGKEGVEVLLPFCVALNLQEKRLIITVTFVFSFPSHLNTSASVRGNTCFIEPTLVRTCIRLRFFWWRYSYVITGEISYDEHLPHVSNGLNIATMDTQVGDCEADGQFGTPSSRRPLLPPCRICGGKASGYHYGVNSCEACKVSVYAWICSS